jgi:hypothetical protein
MTLLEAQLELTLQNVVEIKTSFTIQDDPA